MGRCLPTVCTLTAQSKIIAIPFFPHKFIFIHFKSRIINRHSLAVILTKSKIVTGRSPFCVVRTTDDTRSVAVILVCRVSFWDFAVESIFCCCCGCSPLWRFLCFLVFVHGRWVCVWMGCGCVIVKYDFFDVVAMAHRTDRGGRVMKML